jgi:hypothetical protein
MFAFTNTSFAAWVESKHQGASIRHPKGWKVDWSEMTVNVGHPENRMIWCYTQFTPFQGSSRQLAEAVLQRVAGQVGDVRSVQQKQVSQRPDIYGIKFSGQADGVPFTSLVLTATEDGRNFVIRQFSSPTKQYDEMKLTLIPILCSLRSQAEATAKGDAKQGGWQVIQSPGGVWRFRAPAGWRPIVRDQRTEFTVGEVRGPKEQDVTVMMARGDAVHQDNIQRMYPNLVRENPAEYQRQMRVQYLPATEIVKELVTSYQVGGMRNLQLTELKPLQPDTAQYTTNYTTSGGVKIMEEGILHNSSVPHAFGDYNLFTVHFVKAYADIFPGERSDLWQTLNSFEATPQFGAPLMQLIAQMRKESMQAATNMVMNNLRTSQNIARQHAGIAQQRPGMMTQQGQGWINAVTGQEVVRDPQTGQRWQVPVGGQYIYGRNTGEVIRADRPLQTHELPEGFRQFEALK